MNRGIGQLERYDYKAALESFSPLVKLHPKWLAAHINLGLAALNLQEPSYLKQAEASFRAALKIDAKCAHALLSLGILYRHRNELEKAIEVLDRASKVDPNDPYVLYYLGASFADLGQRDRARPVLEKTVRLQPSFASAWYRLGTIYARLGKEGRAKRREFLRKFQRLERGKAGIKAGVKYGEGGPYNQAIRGTLPPGAPASIEAGKTEDSFELGEFTLSLAKLAPGVKKPDGGTLSPGFALADYDADGQLDVTICGAAGPDGRRSTLVGMFDSEARFISASTPDEAHLCAHGDFDGDGHIDLVTAGPQGVALHTGDGKGIFTPSAAKGISTGDGFVVRLLAVDFDSDWDLDIVCLTQHSVDGAIHARLHLFANLQSGSFRDVAPGAKVAAFEFPATELIAADLDGDIDLDFAIIDGRTGKPHWIANDRVWSFRIVTPVGDALTAPGIRSTCGDDLDADGDHDLVVFCGDRVHVWRNDGLFRFVRDARLEAALDGKRGSSGVVFDANRRLESEILVTESPASAVSFVLGRPVWIVADFESGVRVAPIDADGTWLGVDLKGPGLEVAKRQMVRSNTSGIGAQIEVRAGRSRRVTQRNTGSGGTARSAVRFFCGLDGESSADYVRILWPDAVLQSEIGLAAGKFHRIEEVERKPSSCPVLFAWDGEEQRFIADVLGVGGLGYFLAPGTYGSPDPTEILKLPDLGTKVDENGERYYDLRLLEPLEESTYLDDARLLTVEHPEDVDVLPLEMFAVSGPKPEFELLAYRRSARPAAAVDHRGEDVREALLRVDHDRAPRLELDRRFPGVARGDHAIEIDFGAGVDDLLRDGREGEELFLMLFGHIEYGYSTSNFASWQSGFTARVPSFFVERDGRWVALRKEWGFPAGYPRWMAVDLAGLLRPGDRRIRIETNLEIQWDEALLVSAERIAVDSAGLAQGPVRVESLGLEIREQLPRRAELRHRGFPLPTLDGEAFDYDHFDSLEPYRVMPGSFTRLGDVRELLASADDRLVVFGPGDEIVFEFAAETRRSPQRHVSRFWKCVGYCKDIDLHTGRPQGIEPLPFRAMSGYPYGPTETYPASERLRRYRETWNTRVVEPGVMTPVSELLREK